MPLDSISLRLSRKENVQTFLRKVMIIREHVCQALAAHRLHGDTVGQAVLLIETSFGLSGILRGAKLLYYQLLMSTD